MPKPILKTVACVILPVVMLAAFAQVLPGQTPPCIRSVSAVEGGKTVAVPLTPYVASAVSAAIGTPGVAAAASSGGIGPVNVTLCSGLVVNVTLTGDVVAAVTAAVPATQPATQPVAPATQPTSRPTTAPLPTPQPPTPQPPATPAQSNTYSVAASEILKLSSTVSVDGVLQPRKWIFQGAVKEGFNANFWLPATTAAGSLPLVESDLSGGNSATHAVAVQADPYHVVWVAPNADLAALINAAPDLRRFELAANTDYAITVQPFVSQRLQIVGQSGTTITCKPVLPPGGGDWNALYAVWTTTPTAKVGLMGLTVSAYTGGRFNSQGKTGTGAVYCSIGSAWCVDCTFDGVDLGMMADSTVTHQADGILVQGCTAPLTYGQMVWMNGIHGDIDSCSGHSLLEHPIRASIVDLKTNQLPQLWRVYGSKFDGTHANASTVSPGKESVALRDGKYFFVQSNKFVGWGECGQGVVQAWDYWGNYVFNGNQWIDPSTAPKTATLNVRAGTNGPGSVTNNTCTVPIIVTARMPPAMGGNKP